MKAKIKKITLLILLGSVNIWAIFKGVELVKDLTSDQRYYLVKGMCETHLEDQILLNGDQKLRLINENKDHYTFLSENSKVLFRCTKSAIKTKTKSLRDKLPVANITPRQTKASTGEIHIVSGVCSYEGQVIDVLSDSVLKILSTKGTRPFEKISYTFQKTDSDIFNCEQKDLVFFEITFEQYQKYVDSQKEKLVTKEEVNTKKASKQYAYVSSKCSLDYEIDKKGNTKEIRLALLRSPILVEKVDKENKNVVGLLMNGKFKSRRITCNSDEKNTVTLEPVYDEEMFLKNIKPLKERI